MSKKKLIQNEINQLRKVIERLLRDMPEFNGDIAMARILGQRVANLESLVELLKE